MANTRESVPVHSPCTSEYLFSAGTEYLWPFLDSSARGCRARSTSRKRSKKAVRTESMLFVSLCVCISAKTSCCGGNKEFKANAADLFQRAALEYKKGSQFKESGQCHDG